MLKAWRGLGGLPRDLWLICISALVNRLGLMVLPFLTLYATKRLGFSPTEAGALLVIYGIGAMVSAPAAGRISDRYGAVRVVKASLLLTGAILLFLPLAQTYAAVGIVLFLLALVTEAGRPATMTAITALVSPEQHRPAFALHRLAVNLGMSVGPALGGFLSEHSFWWVAGADAATSIAAAVILIAAGVRDPERAPAPRSTPVRLGGLSDPRLLIVLAGSLLVAVVFFQNMSTMPLFMVRDLNLSPSTFGLMFTCNTVVIVLAEVPLNVAMANWSHRWSLALGALLCAVGFGAMGLATEAWGILATVLVWTVGEMILFPSLAAAVASIAPAGRVGSYMGWYMLSFSVAFAAGPWVGTEIYDALGGRWLWAICLGVGLASAVTFALLRSPRSADESAAG